MALRSPAAWWLLVLAAALLRHSVSAAGTASSVATTANESTNLALLGAASDFNCTAGLAQWRTLWSPAKKAWCCTHHHLGCKSVAKYDCEAELSAFEIKWTVSKKVWCCEHEAKGCSANTTLSTSSTTSTSSTSSTTVSTTTTTATTTSTTPTTTSTTATTTSRTATTSTTTATTSSTTPSTTSTTVTTTSTTRKTTSTKAPTTTVKPTTTMSTMAARAAATTSSQSEVTHEKAAAKAVTGAAATAKGGDEYSCVPRAPRFEKDWSHKQRLYCCKHRGRACPSPPATTAADARHDCVPRSPHWEKAWSEEQRSACCRRHGRGCSSGDSTGLLTVNSSSNGTNATSSNGTNAAGSNVVVKGIETGKSNASRQNKIIQLGHNDTDGGTNNSSKNSSATERYSCSPRSPHWEKGWSAEHKVFCCRQNGRGCASKALENTTVHSTTTKADTTSEVGTTTSSALKTKKPLVYNCTAGASNWTTGWSDGKRVWCCKNEQVACQPTTTAPLVPRTPTLPPFNCVVGFGTWRTSWTADQKKYCCAKEGRGCPDPTSTRTATATRTTKATTTPAPASSTTTGVDGCNQTCMYNDESLTCKEHIHRAAFSEFLGDPNSCEAARDIMAARCSVCARCTSEGADCKVLEAPKVPEVSAEEACSTVCGVSGQMASCTERINWAAQNMFRTKSDPCSEAHDLVMGQCPTCEGCTLDSTGCKSTAGPGLVLKYELRGKTGPRSSSGWTLVLGLSGLLCLAVVAFTTGLGAAACARRASLALGATHSEALAREVGTARWCINMLPYLPVREAGSRDPLLE